MQTTAQPGRQRSLRVGTSPRVSSDLGPELELPANMETEKSPGPLLKVQFSGLSLLTVWFERSEAGPRNRMLTSAGPLCGRRLWRAALQNPSAVCGACVRVRACIFPQSHFIHFFQLVRKVLKDLRVCPQTVDSALLPQTGLSFWI